MKAGPLIVLSGPSGVGKTTLVEQLLARNELPLRRAITATTRPPRPGEHPGRDYHFWSIEQFQQALATNQMLEHAIVHGQHYYGTPRSEIGQDDRATILVIDVQGAAQVRQQLPGQHLSVFVRPPSWEELEARLASRGTEDPVKRAARLRSARNELARQNEFDVRIVNRTLEDAVLALRELIREQLHR